MADHACPWLMKKSKKLERGSEKEEKERHESDAKGMEHRESILYRHEREKEEERERQKWQQYLKCAKHNIFYYFLMSEKQQQASKNIECSKHTSF